MSDGWVATHASDAPRIARLRWSPSRAGQPVPGARLLHAWDVSAAGALQEVPAGGRHVPQLAGRAGEQRLAEHRIAAADLGVRGQVAVADHRADPQRAVRQLGHVVQRQPGHVDQRAGRGDAELHQVDQVRAARDEHRLRILRQRRDRALHVGRLVIGELPHLATSAMAGTMFA
jgi:hypothetical protein